MAVELKKGQKVSLKKEAVNQGEISVNLNWNQGKAKGFFAALTGPKSVDLDLGCLYEMKNGQRGVIQALGNQFGGLQRVPYISLDGDDRTGESADGETLRVNGAKVAEFRRILVFTYIYEGVAQWKGVDGVVTVRCAGSEDIIVRMDEYGSDLRMCAIAMLENQDDQTFSVEKLVTFHGGHEKLDQAYGWNLKWTPGRK